MANVYDKLKEMNLTLPTPPAKGGLYTPVMEFGDHLLYCSGCGPQINGTSINGKLGKDLTVEQGQEAALRCMLNLLANLDAKLGDLNRIKRFVKVLAFVNSADDFTQQPQVVNGGSQLLLDLYGEERGLPARTAMGVNATPGNISVEIELLAEYEYCMENDIPIGFFKKLLWRFRYQIRKFEFLTWHPDTVCESFENLYYRKRIAEIHLLSFNRCSYVLKLFGT